MPQQGVSFDSTWRGRTKVRLSTLAEVRPFIAAHYLHRRPGVCVLPLCVEVDAVPVGMILFALPPREVHKRYGGLTWELARLYLIDALPRNAETFVIGGALRYIQRTHRAVQFIISYADPSVGHTGTIYKASNFIADGRTDDERKSPRCDYRDATGKVYSRRAHVPAGLEVKRVPRVSKFRYYFKLHK